MKKLLVLVLVLAISSIATAATIDVVILDGPEHGDFEGIPSYQPSDWIVIGVIPDGFSQNPPMDDIGRMKIAQVTGTGGEAANPVLTAYFDDLGEPGTVVNSAGTLITGVDGSVALGSPAPPNGDPLYTFEFHVPDEPYSTIIVIDLDGLELTMPFGDPLSFTYGGPIEIHVSPEPMTIALLGLGGLFLRRRK